MQSGWFCYRSHRNLERRWWWWTSRGCFQVYVMLVESSSQWPSPPPLPSTPERPVFLLSPNIDDEKEGCERWCLDTRRRFFSKLTRWSWQPVFKVANNSFLYVNDFNCCLMDTSFCQNRGVAKVCWSLLTLKITSFWKRGRKLGVERKERKEINYHDRQPGNVSTEK